MERFHPGKEPAVLLDTLVRIPKVGRETPVDPPLLDTGGIVPFQRFIELVLFLDYLSVDVQQIEVVIAFLNR